MNAQPETTIVAIITARGGSKSLPGKNVAALAGKPLVSHSIDAALNCPHVTDTIVSTDDPEIAAAAKDADAKVIDRPAALATDTASSYDAVKHALEALEEQGVSVEEANLEMIPKTMAEVDEETAKANQELIDWLDELDDVDAIYHNMEVMNA